MSLIIQHLFSGMNSSSSSRIQLKPGQVFLGNVTKWYPDQLAQLKLGPLHVTAKLEASLEKGKVYLFRVMGSEGVPRLKVIDSAPVISPSNIPSEQSANMVLRQMGLGQSYNNVLLVQRFIQENIPFTQQNISEGAALLQSSSMDREQNLNLVVKMLQYSLPLTKDTFLSFASLSSDRTISEAIRSLEKALSVKSSFQSSHSPLAQLLQSVVIKGEEIQATGKTGGLNGQNLLDIFVKVGLQDEWNVRQYSKQASTLKSMLLQLIQDPSQNESAVRRHAEFIVQRLTALQLLSRDDSYISHTVMQFPVEWGGVQRDWTVQWEGRKDNSGIIDEDHCRIVFYLQLEYLKETLIDVQIQNRVITLTIFNDNEKPTSFQRDWYPFLKEQLHSLNYHLSAIKWTTPPSSPDDQKTVSELDRDKSMYRGVDIRI
ncbi:hypothetical protein [Evansella tamaricis]|uniref:Flagellar hook-length control protein-like C-terminal domain-containing protein n=1 Tax=Evansella tamaricis TaxID=2069301 RepID=A0ABS6JM12_9BACI|nr:hypothetical protein [Evansella tamaricis]MBU9714573.1 hypothetical protein [Evansella tamaricis]